MSSIAKRPDGTWRARYRDNAGREHAKHFSRKVDAQRWVDDQITASVTGIRVDPKLGRVTIGEWSAQWLDTQAQLKPSTRARYEGILRVQVLPRWSAIRLADVSHADVAAWLASLDLAPATVRQAHRVLALVLGLAVRDGRIARNPAAGVPLPRSTRGDKRFLTHAEWRPLRMQPETTASRCVCWPSPACVSAS